MKIILLQDVKTLGKKGEMVEVSDGYARNMIIPKKLGVPATEKNKNDLKLRKAHEEKVAKERLENAEALKGELAGKQIVVSMCAGEGGKAFGSVSAKEIAEAAKAQHGLELDRKKIVLEDPIKTFGMHEVPIKLHSEVAGTLYVLVKEQ